MASTFSGSVAKTSEESARLERRADVQVTKIDTIQGDLTGCRTGNGGKLSNSLFDGLLTRLYFAVA